MSNPAVVEQVKEMVVEMEGNPNACRPTGNKALDAFYACLGRRSTTTEGEFEDGKVIFTPPPSTVSASGTDAQGVQPAKGDAKGKDKEKEKYANMLSNLFKGKTAPNTNDGTADHPKSRDEVKAEMVKPNDGTGSDHKTMTFSQRAASIFFGPDFKADLAKTAKWHLILDLILVSSEVSPCARFVATLFIFAAIKFNTGRKLEKSMKNKTAAQKAYLEKAVFVMSCWAFIAIVCAVKIILSS